MPYYKTAGGYSEMNNNPQGMYNAPTLTYVDAQGVQRGVSNADDYLKTNNQTWDSIADISTMPGYGQGGTSSGALDWQTIQKNEASTALWNQQRAASDATNNTFGGAGVMPTSGPTKSYTGSTPIAGTNLSPDFYKNSTSPIQGQIGAINPALAGKPPIAGTNLSPDFYKNSVQPYPQTNTGTNTTTGTTAPNTGTQGGTTGNPNDLANQYSALLGNTTGVDSAQKAIDDQNNLARNGIQNIGEQPIGMSFISGQQADIEKRNNNLQIPLQQRLANEQQKRQASLDNIKFQLDRSDKAEANAETKRHNIATEGKETTKTASIQEYEYAKANGYKGTYPQYQNEDANRKRSIAAAGVGGSGLNSKQYTALNQITTKFQADPIIKQSLQGQTAITIADQVIANPNSATSQLKSLYVLVKNLDPDSAVKEGEIQLANQTQSYLQQFGNTLARITEGRVVSPDAAVALAQATKELMTAWNTTAKNREQQYTSQANVLGISNDFSTYIAGSNLGYNAPSNTSNTGSSYAIKSGDTFYKLAQANGTTVEALQQANPGISPNSLKVGQSIKLPSGGTTGGTYKGYTLPN